MGAPLHALPRPALGREHATTRSSGRGSHEIPDAELWQAHEHRRHRLVTRARRWLRDARRARGARRERDRSSPTRCSIRSALTIGFARRFATYKRAALLFSDLERVKQLLGDAERPVQLVFAGKAHPQDKGGKELIRTIVHASRDAGRSAGTVVFLEDYDMRDRARAGVAASTCG